MSSESSYFETADIPAIRRDYPIGADFVQRFRGMSRDALLAMQQQRFLEVMRFAWQVPFYAKRWRAAGLEPGDVTRLEDLVGQRKNEKEALEKDIGHLDAQRQQIPPEGPK